jgi:hypothetical protein
MPNLVSEDDVVLLQLFDDHDLFDGCEHEDMSQMMQGEASIMECEILEVSHGNSAQHNLTAIAEEIKIDPCSENECQFSYSCSSSVVSVEQWMPCPLDRNFVNDIVDQSATSRSYNEQQTLPRLESRDCLVSCHGLVSSSSSMVRMHSLAGNPLPQGTTSSRAPPPSTLCPHALKHKFPEIYGDMESDEKFLKRCLRHTSLDMLISRPPAKMKIHREHSLAGYPLDEVYLDIPLGNSIYFFEEIERLKTNNNV